jgi:SAM-dependent methyltransferase
MARSDPFEQHTGRYEAWFEHHDAAYVSELLALRSFVPMQGRGVEIGVGSARFAAPLGVQVGIDPSPAMLDVARARGIDVVEGTAEALPFADDSFDHALVVTTICFVDSPAKMLAQARRTLKPAGRLVIGFIDRESPLGQDYVARLDVRLRASEVDQQVAALRRSPRADHRHYQAWGRHSILSGKP